MDIRVKAIPEDFIVQESLSMMIVPEQDNMNYRVLMLSKKGYTTFEGIETVSEFYGIELARIGYAGLKDEDGITNQFITIPVEYDINNRMYEFNEQQRNIDGKFMILTHLGYSDTQIRVGKLQGNSFKIRLRNVEKSCIESLYGGMRFRISFPNYYDTQRFGLPNMPKMSHRIGKALFDENYQLAFQYLKESQGYLKT